MEPLDDRDSKVVALEVPLTILAYESEEGKPLKSLLVEILEEEEEEIERGLVLEIGLKGEGEKGVERCY
ncbi:hypothetical protein QYF36_012380 [Acer negundo]|nr:hypothetical protein QYF36_012380 [Acer negundo]